MNFLAHLHLSGSSNELKIGNFIADFVKGKGYEKYPIGIQQGIILHRHIDYFTDTHQLVSVSKQRLYSRYHKYAAVIVDVYYDHFLATKWETFADISLMDFANDFYFMIKDYASILPDKVKAFIPHMIENDWLVNYRNLEGIGQALKGMAKRTTFESGMENAVEELRLYYNDLKEDFLLYYPELVTYVKGLINEFQNGKVNL